MKMYKGCKEQIFHPSFSHYKNFKNKSKLDIFIYFIVWG